MIGMSYTNIEKTFRVAKVMKQVMGNMWKCFFASLLEEQEGQNTIEEIVTKRFLHPLTLFF
jgi:mRNA deadenylase 3'-5' endonuclease subunit Ccr4